MSRRRVLITGAGGFVGRALASGFAELGWDVVGLDRDFDTDADDRIEHVVADLDGGVPPGIGRADLIVHGAWVTTDAETLGVSSSEYERLNLAPLSSLVGYAKEIQPAAFVFLSSSGVFGPTDGGDRLREGDRPTGESAYARLKRLGEDLVLEHLGAGPSSAHVVRLGYLFGPNERTRPTRQGVSPIARWIDAARSGEPLCLRSDDPLREWTYAGDLAHALELLVDSPPAWHPIHLCSSNVYRDSEVAAAIADRFPGTEVVTGRAGPPMKPPMTPSDVPSLRDFRWTDVSEGIERLLAGAETSAGSAVAS